MKNPLKTMSDEKLLELQKPYAGTPYSFVHIKRHMEELRDTKKRILVSNGDITLPQNTTVITIEKVYDRFALGYTYQNNSNTDRIPYTINYSSLLDANNKISYREED